MLCFWAFDSGSWIGTTPVFLALLQIAPVRTVLAHKALLRFLDCLPWNWDKMHQYILHWAYRLLFRFLDCFHGTSTNCTSTDCTGPQGSLQILRLPSLELGQNAPVHTVLGSQSSLQVLRLLPWHWYKLHQYRLYWPTGFSSDS
jgi:hypothetical protein